MSPETLGLGLLLVLILVIGGRVENARSEILKKLDSLFPDVVKKVNQSDPKHNIKP